MGLGYFYQNLLGEAFAAFGAVPVRVAGLSQSNYPAYLPSEGAVITGVIWAQKRTTV